LHEWNRIKREKLLAAGLPEAEFELDYIIPPSLGGAPDNPNNFQLKPGNEVSERKLWKIAYRAWCARDG
jgi:hypothetical protein